jgi:hypothetical protein
MDIALDQIAWHDAAGRPVTARILDGVLVFTPARGSLKDWILWASGKANYYISKLLNQVFNGASYSFPATLYFALWTTTLTAASTGSSGTEASYTSYARVAVTANTTNFPTSSSGAAIQNATAITWPANGGSVQTMTYMAIVDASSAGNMLYFGSITSTAINAGDTPQININGLTASEA